MLKMIDRREKLYGLESRRIDFDMNILLAYIKVYARYKNKEGLCVRLPSFLKMVVVKL